MQPAKISYKVYQGSTFQEAYRWESQTKVYVPIQSISKAAPCVITTTQAHNLPVGWRFQVVGAGGMKEINSVGEDHHLSTGYDSTASELYTVWADQETQWEDARELDAQNVAPTVRPWAGMNSTDAYTAIMNYSPPAGKPVPGNFAPLTNNAKQAYQAWQAELLVASKTIVINQVNSLQYNTYTSGGVVEYSEPVNLTGYKARMQIRKAVGSSEVLYQASSDTGQIDINLLDSTITITIPAATTQSFGFTSAVYSVELYKTDGTVIPFLTGNLTLVQEITR